MKKLIIALIIFSILTAFVVTHSIIMYRFGENAEKICEKIEKSALAENWEEARNNLDKLDELWKKRHFWASLTIRTNLLEDIDISMSQSKILAKIEEKPTFLSEFMTLKKFLEHIPHQEGLSIEEIL